MAAMQTETETTSPKPRFVKVYDQGIEAIEKLMAHHPVASRLYMFFVRHCGHDNAIACTYDTLCQELEVSERTIRRAVRYLEDEKHVVVAKMGTANVYIMNPHEVWKTYEQNKIFCEFSAKALINKTANGNLKRRLTHLLQVDQDADQQSLFEADT